MAQRGENLTYKQNMSKQEMFRVIKAVGLPLLVFALGLFAISNLANFGTKIIAPLSAAMWVIGFIVALLMPSMRQEVLNQTLIFCAIYYLAELGLKILLGIASGASSEMIAASYDQAIPTATGNAIPGYLQNIMWFTAFGIPIGQVTMNVKRLFNFRHNKTLQEKLGQQRGLRINNRDNTRPMI